MFVYRCVIRVYVLYIPSSLRRYGSRVHLLKYRYGLSSSSLKKRWLDYIWCWWEAVKCKVIASSLKKRWFQCYNVMRFDVDGCVVWDLDMILDRMRKMDTISIQAYYLRIRSKIPLKIRTETFFLCYIRKISTRILIDKSNLAYMYLWGITFS